MNTKNILVPLDDSDKTFDSINSLKEFFSSENTVVHLLNIFNNHDAYNTDPSDPNSALNVSKAILDNAETILEGYTVNKIPFVGSHYSIVSDIMSIIEKENIDYVVMTKTGKGFFDRYVVGSTTRNTLNRSSIPVMIIP